jgi:hypothetical protein
MKIVTVSLLVAALAAGCNLDSSGKRPCAATTDCQDGYACIDQMCVVASATPDAGLPSPHGDASPTPQCTPEEDTQFCARLGANCGMLTADDNCGESRTAVCGTCASGTSCGGSNVCGCEPETAAELCTAQQAACGSLTAVDRCGATRTVTCADTCAGSTPCGGGWEENRCGSTTCTVDGWCRPTTQSISQYFDFNAVWMAAPSAGWAAGYGEFAGGGKLYRWNGTVWRKVATTVRGLFAITGTGQNDAWIAGGYGHTWHYDGSHILATGTAGCSSCDVFDLWALGPQDVWGAGYDHKAMHYEGSGWGVTSLAPSSAAPKAVWAAAANDVWIVGDAGMIRHWNGLDWTATTIGTAGLLDVWGSGASDIWAVGTGGRLLHYNGSAWSVVAGGTTQTLRAITGTASNRVWFAGDNGVILHWNGTTLAAQQSGTTRVIKSMWALAPNDIWAVGDDGLILHRQ